MTPTHPGLRPYGFDGPVDYIERITYAIWNLPHRNLDLIRKYYAPSTAIHLDAGDLVGDRIVIANTAARLQTYPDFHGAIDDTIWTGSEEDGYRTSMRWTWTGTDTGGTIYGPATGRPVTFTAIANCIVRGEVIIEEWLGANPLAQARQLGYTLEDALHTTRYPTAHRVARPSFGFTRTAEGELVRRAFTGALEGRFESGLYAPGCVTDIAPDIQREGALAMMEWADSLGASIASLAVTIDDQYSLPASATVPLRVATQWRIAGTGPQGPVEFSLISHHHLAQGKVTAQWLAYDELALAHQGIVLPQPATA